VCDLLDRKLFETSVAQAVTAIAATATGLEESVAALLGVLQRFVTYDLAAVLLAEERTAFVAVGQPTARAHYDEFLSTSADGVAQHGGEVVEAAQLTTRVAQAGGVIVDDPEDLPGGAEQGRMATYLSMPLRGQGGRVVGVLALSSGSPSAFGETALSTLKLVEQPAAIVIDNARMAGARATV
jgi:GAF domain-containing protein